MDALNGLSVLLVEDELLIALDAQEMLSELGAQVTLAATFAEGAAAAMADTFDIAVLDVTLGGQLSFPIGEILADRGTPVVYATGYDLRDRRLDGLRGHWLAKPYTELSLQRAVLAAVAGIADDGGAQPAAAPQSHSPLR